MRPHLLSFSLSRPVHYPTPALDSHGRILNCRKDAGSPRNCCRISYRCAPRSDLDFRSRLAGLGELHSSARHTNQSRTGENYNGHHCRGAVRQHYWQRMWDRWAKVWDTLSSMLGNSVVGQSAIDSDMAIVEKLREAGSPIDHPFPILLDCSTEYAALSVSEEDGPLRPHRFRVPSPPMLESHTSCM